MRWRLDIAYDGSGFHGWASQHGLRTVQGELTDWLTRILPVDQPVELVCAGRTDAGVHARGQVAHVDLPDLTVADLPSRDIATSTDAADPALLGRWLEYRLARVLPADLVVRRVSVASPGFDARFSALWRRYVYRLCDGVADPLHRTWVTSLRPVLDVDAMNAAAERMLGLRDFVAFCRRRDGATTIRHLLDVHAVRVPRLIDEPLSAQQPVQPGLIEITVRADAFCHTMVRSIVGALWDVGSGKRSPDWIDELVSRTERAGDVRVLPPGGLTLEEVGYPPDADLAARAAAARTFRSREELL